ncbi:ABC transporter substrate-binding protein [Micromonospora cathayae]|uniref:ABC transporter substrate-binding protein n=1 Tax=Micromonospora cathayae TaxID=3028804 RepID=A0ABY7ZXY1_9ACTN|nr:ABC transporter substrate-binding protein [Micromonospora sp. HUAS 3]WDZ87763.1 ABC transporter substrate-binding protein [Micromonospora sp. HUAS 3]
MAKISRRSFLTATGATAGALLGGSFLSGCSSDDEKSGGAATLTYSFMATRELPDVGLIQQTLNDLLRQKGATYSVRLNPLQDYNKVMGLKVASGDPGDLYFTAPWSNPYATNASSGNLLALDDLLSRHAPKLQASMSADTWNAARVKGKLYGVINQQRFPKMWGYQAKKEVVEQLGLDPSTISSYAELEPYLARVKQAGKLLPWSTSNGGHGALFHPEIHGYDPIATTLGLAVRYDDSALTALSWFDTPEFEEAVRTARRWNERGYTEPTPPTPNDMQVRWNAGRTAFADAQYLPTNPQYTDFPTIGATFVTTPLLNTDGVLATLTGINADAPHAVEAMSFLEALNTDQDIYRTICFGIEGTHYQASATDPQVLEAGPKQAAWNPNTDWVFGNQFNAPYRNQEDATAKRWERERELNATAVPSKAIGFSLATDSIRTEVAAVTAAIQEHANLAMIGQLKADVALSNLRTALDRAGMPRVLAAAQQQLSEFKNS